MLCSSLVGPNLRAASETSRGRTVFSINDVNVPYECVAPEAPLPS